MPAPGRVERRAFNALPQQVRKNLIAAVAGGPTGTGPGALLVASPERENKPFCFGGLAAVVVALGFLVTGQSLLFVLSLAIGLWLLVSWDSGRRGLRRDPVASGTYLFPNHLLIVTGPDLEVVPNELITHHDFSTDGCTLTLTYPGHVAVLRATVADDLHRAIALIARTRALGPEDLGPDDVIAAVLHSRRLDDGQAPRWTPPYPVLGVPTPLRLGVVSVVATAILAAIAVPLCPVMIVHGAAAAPVVAASGDDTGGGDDGDDIDAMIDGEDMDGIRAYLQKKVPPPDVLRRIDTCCKAHYAKIITAYRKKSPAAAAAEFAAAYFAWAGTHRAQTLIVHFIPGTISTPGTLPRDVQTGPAFSPADLGHFQAKVFGIIANSITSGTDGEIHLEKGKDADSFDDPITNPTIFAQVSVEPSGDIYQQVGGTAQYVGAQYEVAINFEAPDHPTLSINETLSPPQHFIATATNPVYGGGPGSMGSSGGVNSGDVDDGMFVKALGHLGLTVTNAFKGN